MIEGVTLTATRTGAQVLRPLAELAQRAVEGEACQRVDLARHLGDVDEDLGRHVAGVRPVPAHQRLAADDLELRQRQLRLVVQDEVAVLERIGELGLEVPAGDQLLGLALGVDDGRGLRLPGLEQRDVRALHELLGRAPVRGMHGDADREPHAGMLAAGRDGLRGRAQDLVRGQQRVAFIAQVREHEDELAVAEAREVVAGLHHLRQAVPELVEHPRRVHVARAREQSLELVHVDDQHGDAVELRLARGEPRAHGLEAVGVAADLGRCLERCVHGVN